MIGRTTTKRQSPAVTASTDSQRQPVRGRRSRSPRVLSVAAKASRLTAGVKVRTEDFAVTADDSSGASSANAGHVSGVTLSTGRTAGHSLSSLTCCSVAHSHSQLHPILTQRMGRSKKQAPVPGEAVRVRSKTVTTTSSNSGTESRARGAGRRRSLTSVS